MTSEDTHLGVSTENCIHTNVQSTEYIRGALNCQNGFKFEASYPSNNST